MTPVNTLKGTPVNENATPELETDLSEESTTTPLTRKALVLAGSVAGIIIAGGFAFLKNRAQSEEVVEITEEIEIEIDTDPANDTSE